MESRGLSGEIIVMWWHGLARVDAVHFCKQQVALVILKYTGGTWLISGFM